MLARLRAERAQGRRAGPHQGHWTGPAVPSAPGGSPDPRKAVMGVHLIPAESWLCEIPRTLPPFPCHTQWRWTARGKEELLSRLGGKDRKKGERFAHGGVPTGPVASLV